MKLLHVVDTINPAKGGISQAVRTMASEFTKSGIFNEVLTLDLPDVQDVDSIFKINSVGPSTGPWRYSNVLIPWLLDNFSRFDTIIVHGMWLFQGFAVRRALDKYRKGLKISCKKRHVPEVYIMPHGMLDPYFQLSNNRKIKAVRNWIYWKLIESRVVNNANGVLFTCRQECILANKPFSPYRPKRELVIGLGVVDPRGFSPSINNLSNKSWSQLAGDSYFLFLGRIDDKKGIDLLLAAYKRILSEAFKLAPVKIPSPFKLSDEFTTKPIKYPKLVIAGPGINSVYGKMLEKMVDKNALLKANVHFTGMLEGEDKWAAFYGCEAFILPSHQENFGIAVVEALACAKPVLISNQVNISAEVKQEQAGIVGDDTLQGTYESLKNWILLPEMGRLKMQRQARICYEKHFAVDAATGRLLNALSYREKHLKT